MRDEDYEKVVFIGGLLLGMNIVLVVRYVIDGVLG